MTIARSLNMMTSDRLPKNVYRTCYLEKRVGEIRINITDIQEDADRVHALLSNFLVVSAKYKDGEGCMSYMVYHPSFVEVAECTDSKPLPRYNWTLSDCGKLTIIRVEPY